LHSCTNYSVTPFYRRHLPHIDERGHAVFLTWRLHGSLPPNRAFPVSTVNSGRAFATVDKLLDEARTGPFYLRQPAIAKMIVDALYFNASILGHFDLHAFVVMPNHVHLLAAPSVALPKLTKSLKGITSKRANSILGLTGTPFWQEESYDHSVRSGEFEKIRGYIEENPVRAGLAFKASEFQWSSAAWPDRGPAADQGVRPTFAGRGREDPELGP
jgi:putative transposase